jgi:hypothetical protein
VGMKTRSKHGTSKRQTPTTQGLKPESKRTAPTQQVRAIPRPNSPDISGPGKNSPRSVIRIEPLNPAVERRAPARQVQAMPRPHSPDKLSPDILVHEKASPVELLESAVAARRKSQTELSHLRQMLADQSAQMTALQTTGDLHDPAVIAEIGRLQIFTGLLPVRIAAREEEEVKADTSLTQTTNQFVREHLGPRVRQLAARTRAIVEAGLSSHFRDPAALIVAVAQSERVRTIEGLDWSASVNPTRGAIAHAERTLKAWADVDKFEKTLEANAA